MDIQKKKVGRYQMKRRMGLVPHDYNKGSNNYALGAHKNWPGGHYDPRKHAHLEIADRQFLEMARQSR